AAFLLLDPLRADLEAALAERDDELIRSRVITRRRPVVAAFRARASWYPLCVRLLQHLGAVCRPAGPRIERLPHVLKHGFLVAEVLAGLPIELPEDAVLPDREQQVLVVVVDEHTLEHDIEIQCLCRRMLEVPGELACVDIQRERRAGEERVVFAGHAAADRHPGLGLRGTPKGEIQSRIVAAGNPRLAAGAEQIRQRAPGVASGLTLPANGVEPPNLLTGGGVVRADEAFLFPVDRAPAKPLNQLTLGHDRAAAGAVAALGSIADRRLPYGLAGSRVERDQVRLAGRRKQFV